MFNINFTVRVAFIFIVAAIASYCFVIHKDAIGIIFSIICVITSLLAVDSFME